MTAKPNNDGMWRVTTKEMSNLKQEKRPLAFSRESQQKGNSERCYSKAALCR